ncbi:MAG TPA: TetR/AcrR family transcriptional regulator [Bacteroidales bacterium]|nr:TetR/AcrR family transcriptional regulator [Bacteroidales bacterium]
MERPEDIYNRVIELYHKFGIRSVTMDDIARELGISKKTLYQVVDDKRDLVTKVMHWEFDRVNACMENLKVGGTNAIEELLEISRFVNLHLREYSSSLEYDLRKYYPVIYQDIHRQKREVMYHTILANIKRGKDEGLYRGELREEVIAKLYVSRFESMQEDTMFSIEELTSGEIFREIFTYHIMGIANEEGIKIFLKNRHRLHNSSQET